jgi:hypothetical protein
MIRHALPDDARTLSFSRIAADIGIFVVLEAPDRLTDTAKRASYQVIEHAAAVAMKLPSSDGEGIARALADALGSALEHAPPRSVLPPWAFVVVVVAARARVEVCMAGPHRVHLVQAGSLVATAREHVLALDEPPLDWPPHFAASIRELGVHGNLVTRAVGRVRSRPPTVSIWPVECPYTVLICGADHHRGRDPSTDVDSLMNPANTAPPHDVAIIEFQAPRG